MDESDTMDKSNTIAIYAPLRQAATMDKFYFGKHTVTVCRNEPLTAAAARAIMALECDDQVMVARARGWPGSPGPRLLPETTAQARELARLRTECSRCGINDCEQDKVFERDTCVTCHWRLQSEALYALAGSLASAPTAAASALASCARCAADPAGAVPIGDRDSNIGLYLRVCVCGAAPPLCAIDAALAVWMAREGAPIAPAAAPAVALAHVVYQRELAHRELRARLAGARAPPSSGDSLPAHEAWLLLALRDIIRASCETHGPSFARDIASKPFTIIFELLDLIPTAPAFISDGTEFDCASPVALAASPESSLTAAQRAALEARVADLVQTAASNI